MDSDLAGLWRTTGDDRPALPRRSREDFALDALALLSKRYEEALGVLTGEARRHSCDQPPFTECDCKVCEFVRDL